MPRVSAGLLMYRFYEDNCFQVLRVHPGRPYFKNKDEEAWSIPKGEHRKEQIDQRVDEGRNFE